MGACSSNPAAVVANNTTAPPLSSKQVPNGSILNKKGGGQGGDTNSREVKFTNSTEQNLDHPPSPPRAPPSAAKAPQPQNITTKTDNNETISSSNTNTTTAQSTKNNNEEATTTTTQTATDPLSSSTKSINSSSHRRRKSRNLTHSDSKIGLNEIICGDLPNPNLVRIEVPLGKPIEEVYDGVHDGPVLGSGISGIVRLVKHRTTQVSYAVKCLDLALIDSDEGLRQLKEEIYIMCQLDHPNIVRLEEVYESHSEIYLVQEVCKGGELFDRLDEQPDYHYTEAQCARLVKQMLSSVRYIHNKGIIHRDLKLENFLFSELEAGSELKMIDFGLSKHFTFGEVHHEAVGTPYTVAPEVIRGSYDERCDVWAIGVITYLLLSGEPPFGGCGGPETLMQVRDNILKGAFQFEPVDVWETVSVEAKDFIKSLLVIDPMDRPTAHQVKESRWLKMWADRENNGNEDNKINPQVVKALVGFKEYSDMRKLLCEVLSFTLLPEQIQGLRMEFEKYDQEGTGEITLSTLKKVLIGNAVSGSLGGLTEDEVVDIFNAMRVRKGETSIHWHDFIAAGLSQCQVDDRNLRLAFERLDQEHKGYITLDNVMDLMGDDTFDPNEDQMLKMWGESMKDVNNKTALINYDDFVLLMKGQKRDRDSRFLRASLEGLAPVAELLEGDEDDNVPSTPLGSFNEKDSPMKAGAIEAIVPPLDLKKIPTEYSSPSRSNSGSGSGSGSKSLLRMGSNSAPATPLHMGRRFDEVDQGDSPLSMDADDTPEGGRVTFKDAAVFKMPDLDLTPPQTPVRGPSDYVTPASSRATFDPNLISILGPPDLSLSGANALQTRLTRGRSVSMDEKERVRNASFDEEDPDYRRTSTFKRDSRRAIQIPEHTHNVSEIERAIADKTKTPLVVNRKLYRAHREFRHAVTEACKRFEDEQMRRAKEELRAQESATAKHTAGLVMRHGQSLSDQSIKTFLKKTLDEQQKKVDQANRRGGRGRRSRKKTISDMSGMLGPSAPGADTTPVVSAEKRKTMDAVPKQEVLQPIHEKEHDNNLLRNPTKPGEFRKTNYNPFMRKWSIDGNTTPQLSTSA